MIHCFSCGVDVPTNMTYCLHCGSQLDAETVIKLKPVVTAPKSDMSRTTPHTETQFQIILEWLAETIRLVAFGAIALIVLGLLVAYLFLRK